MKTQGAQTGPSVDAGSAEIERPERGSAGLRDLDSSWTFESFSECRQRLDACDPDQLEDAGRVFTLEHPIPVGEGRTLYVREFFTLFSWLRRPRRAVVLLNGGVFRGSGWSIPVSGYDGTAMAAKHGMFTYTLDYLGTGRSSEVENGHDLSIDKNITAVRKALQYIRSFRAVPRVDLVGEGYGGIIACQLAADAEQVRSCVLASMAYKDIAAGPTRSPEVVELLTNSPDGYFPVPTDGYDLFLTSAPSEVREHIRATQPGRYPVHVNLMAHKEPPIFDASVARVSGLVLFGAKDFVVGPRDPYDLAQDYGTSGARLEVNEEAGHAPRIESPETAAWLWGQIFGFIDP